jgi:hypothetical protein
MLHTVEWAAEADRTQFGTVTGKSDAVGGLLHADQVSRLVAAAQGPCGTNVSKYFINML